MNETDALDLVRAAIWTVVSASSPCVLAAMAVGLAVGLLQALTQIQEATLTFVPKIITIYFVAIVTAHFIGAQVFALARLAFVRIENGF